MFPPKDKKKEKPEPFGGAPSGPPKGKFPKPPAKVLEIGAKKPAAAPAAPAPKPAPVTPEAPTPDAGPESGKTSKQDAGYSQQQLCVSCKFYDAKDASCQKVDEYSPGEDPGFINPLASCQYWEGDNEQAEEEMAEPVEAPAPAMDEEEAA